MSGNYPKFMNDRGVPEIRIGVREFRCIGVSPPQDHPHIYIDMGAADTILCPYCGTRFRFDPRLTLFDADPPGSFFGDQSAACAEPQLAFTRFGRISRVDSWRNGMRLWSNEENNEPSSRSTRPMHLPLWLRTTKPIGGGAGSKGIGPCPENTRSSRSI